MISDSPSIQMPDAFAHTRDLFASAMSGMKGLVVDCKNLDDIFYAACETVGKLVNKSIDGVCAVGNAAAGAVAGAARSATAPFNANHHFSPSPSPAVARGKDIEAPSKGLSKEVAPNQVSTKVGRSASHHHVSDAYLGTLTPSVGIPMAAHSMGYSRALGC